MIRLLREYHKGVRAFVGSVFVWWMAVKQDGIRGDEWDALYLTAAVALGVIDAKNTTTSRRSLSLGERDEPLPWQPPDRGATVIAWILAVFLILLALKVLGLI